MLKNDRGNMQKDKSNSYICIMKQILFYLIALCVLTSCLGKLETSSSADIINVGQKLPDFEVVLSDGMKVTSSMLQGKPSVIVFFNTACKDCQKELPLIQQLYEENTSNKVTFLCISRAEGKASIESYWQQNKLTLPYSAQEDKTIYNKFATSTIPRVYISDSSGTVKNIYVERTELNTLRTAINQLK